MLLDGIVADIYTLRFLKPFDEKHFIELARNYDGIVIIEDAVKIGGVAEYIEGLVNKNEDGNKPKVKVIAFPDRFVSNGNRSQILESAGLSINDICNSARDSLK